MPGGVVSLAAAAAHPSRVLLALIEAASQVAVALMAAAACGSEPGEPEWPESYAARAQQVSHAMRATAWVVASCPSQRESRRRIASSERARRRRGPLPDRLYKW
ncbi:MAG TPA: hypothetical protein VIF83_08455 [Gemmatimonadaceae bacterium]